MDERVAYLKLAAECSVQEISSFQAKEKLRRWLKLSDENLSKADKILSKLIAESYINDNRFLEAFINDKLKFSLWGPQKIEEKLVLIGFSKELVQNELEKCNKLVEEVFTTLVNKKREELESKRSVLLKNLEKKYNLKTEKIRGSLETFKKKLESIGDRNSEEYKKIYKKYYSEKQKLIKLQIELKNSSYTIQIKEKGKILAFLKSRGFAGKYLTDI